MGAGYTGRIGASKRVGGQLQIGKDSGVITDALVNANATLTDLKAAVTAAALHANLGPMKVQVNKALDLGKTMDLLSETHGVTTVAGLIALTDASSGFRQGLMA